MEVLLPQVASKNDEQKSRFLAALGMTNASRREALLTADYKLPTELQFRAAA